MRTNHQVLFMIGTLGFLACGDDAAQNRINGFVGQQKERAKRTEVLVAELSQRAERALEAKQFDVAQGLAARAYRLNPQNDALFSLNQRLHALAFLNAAQPSEQLSLQIRLDKEEALTRKVTATKTTSLAEAVLLLRDGKTNDAAERLSALSLDKGADPDGLEARIYFERGRLSVQNGDLDSAVNLFHQTLATDETLWRAGLQLGQILSQKGDHKVAVEQLESVVKQYEDGVIYFVFGRVLQAAGEAARAATAFERALTFPNAPKNTDSELGKVYFSLKNFSRARDTFAKAFAARGALVDRFNEGIALKGMGQFESSAVIFEEIVRAKPDLPRAHAELVGALVMAKQGTLARQALDRLRKLKSKFPGLGVAEGEITSMLAPNGQAKEGGGLKSSEPNMPARPPIDAIPNERAQQKTPIGAP